MWIERKNLLHRADSTVMIWGLQPNICIIQCSEQLDGIHFKAVSSLEKTYCFFNRNHGGAIIIHLLIHFAHNVIAFSECRHHSKQLLDVLKCLSWFVRVQLCDCNVESREERGGKSTGLLAYSSSGCDVCPFLWPLTSSLQHCSMYLSVSDDQRHNRERSNSSYCQFLKVELSLILSLPCHN